MSQIIDLGQILNESELEQIKIFVKDNKDLWVHESLYFPKAKNSPRYIFGSPLMYSENDETEYIKLYESLRPQRELKLKQISLLNSVLNLLQNHYNLPTMQIPGTSLPGFQIYSNHENRAEEFTPPYYHIDSTILDNWESLRLDPNLKFKMDTVNALLVAIELPNIGKTINYIMDGKRHTYTYKKGHAYTWRSDILHRTGHVVLSGSECRIVYLCFYSIQSDKILYYY
jgi:hypothetical protein